MAGAKNKENFSIRNLTKGKLPRLPFLDIKNAVLGKKYVLSLVMVGDAFSKKLNTTYRNKNKPTNVLSFSLNKNEGEIFLNLKKAQSEAKQFEKTYKNFVGYLFIHGLLHLKGMSHGSKMNVQELIFLKKFKLEDK